MENEKKMKLAKKCLFKDNSIIIIRPVSNQGKSNMLQLQYVGKNWWWWHEEYRNGWRKIFK